MNNNLDQSAVWVTFDRCSLLVSDSVTTETGKKLTNKHINFAQHWITMSTDGARAIK